MMSRINGYMFFLTCQLLVWNFKIKKYKIIFFILNFELDYLFSTNKWVKNIFEYITNG